MDAIVKICGLRETEHVDAAVDAGAGLTGFVFFPPSPRNITIEEATALTRRVPAGIGKVALTVDADDAFLAAIVAGAGIDTLQLHGSETVARVRHIKSVYGLPVIKALPVSSAADITDARAYEGDADMLLFDAKPPKDATRPGGNAESFDWSILTDARWPGPWMLAGGLDPDNVAEAIRRTRATDVDVSSGVEDKPGRKNPEKIRAFLKAAAGA